MRSSKIIAFAATQRVSEARSFYRDVLNLTEIEDTPFALVFEANGTTLRIQKVDTVVTTPYTTLGWEVEDISSMVKDLLAKGVKFEKFEKLPQNDLKIWSAPDGAKIAWFKDPDGNLLSVTELTVQNA